MHRSTCPYDMRFNIRHTRRVPNETHTPLNKVTQLCLWNCERLYDPDNVLPLFVLQQQSDVSVTKHDPWLFSHNTPLRLLLSVITVFIYCGCSMPSSCVYVDEVRMPGKQKRNFRGVRLSAPRKNPTKKSKQLHICEYKVINITRKWHAMIKDAEVS